MPKRGKVLLASEIDDVVVGSVGLNQTLLTKTAQSYQYQAKKVCEIFEIDFNPDQLLPLNVLTDCKMAKVFHSIGIQTNYGKSSKKMMLATLNQHLKKHQLPNIIKFPHLYPLVTQQLEVSSFYII